MHTAWKDYIESTSDMLRGKPRIKNTRIPVALVLGYLADGYSADEIKAEFPDLTTESIAACLDYARELADFEVALASQEGSDLTGKLILVEPDRIRIR